MKNLTAGIDSDGISENHDEGMATRLRIALAMLLLVGCNCNNQPPTLAKYRVQRVSPSGTVHGEWIVESSSYPLVDIDWGGTSFVKTRTTGDWVYTGLFAPKSWLLNVVEERTPQ